MTSIPGITPRVNQLLTAEQPTSTEHLRGVPANYDGCYCGPDADIDRLRALLRQGWNQQDASFFIWGPGPVAQYIDHLASVNAAWELVTALLEEL